MTPPTRLSRGGSSAAGGGIPPLATNAAERHRLAAIRELEAIAFHAQADTAAMYNAGTSFLRLADPAQAICVLQEVVRRTPVFAHAHLNLGIALHAVGRRTEAMDALRCAVRLEPGDARAQGALAALLEAEQRWREAIKPRRALARVGGGSAVALVDLAHTLERTGRYRAALAVLQRAQDIDPHDPRTLTTLGVALYGAGRLGEAREAFERVLSQRPGDPLARFSRAFTFLKRGDLVQGWRDYEARLETPDGAARVRGFCAPRWTGEHAPDKTLLLVAEQGFGDTLQMARYLARARARVGRLIVWAPRPLARLLAVSGGADEVVAHDARPPPHDAWTPMFSLPSIFGPCSAREAAPEAYLSAEPTLVQSWAKILPTSRPRVGVAWRGSSTSRVNLGRSLPLSSLRPLAATCAAPLISLQLDAEARELADAPFPLIDLGDAFRAGDFAETAAVIMNLDLVVCCDTAVAHLAGALGRPVWVALGVNSDWRWFESRSDTVWYASMRLFRRRCTQSWEALVGEMAQALAAAPKGMSGAQC
jgi:Flp pilus assembly protein TadD